MGTANTCSGYRTGWSRRSILRAASVTAVGGSVAVAGCIGEARPEETVVLSGDTDFQEIMFADNEDEQSVAQALYDAGLDEGIDLEVVPGPDDTTERRDQYAGALQAGRHPPDIFMMDSGWTIPFILREQTTNLEARLSSEALSTVENDYLDAAVETARDPETDELHALPLFPDFGTMQYRRDLVEDAGYDTESWDTESMSWERFADVTADALEESGVDFGYTTQAAAYEGLACCTFNEVMTTWGGAYFGGEENLFIAGERPITVEEEPVLDAIRMMRSFMHGDDADDTLEGYPEIAPTTIVQWSEEEARGPFAAGNAVMHRNWPYSIAISGTEDEFGEDLGVMPMPHAVTEDEAEYPGAGGPASALGGWHLTLNPETPVEEEAIQVLEAFTDEEVMLTIFEIQGWLPPNLDLIDEVDPEEAGPVARYTEQIQIAGENAIPRPVTDVWPEQSALIFQEVHAAYRGTKSSDEAMSDLSDRLERSERDVGE